MRWLAITLITLVCATAVALLVRHDPGYVLIAAGDWTLETTATLAGVAVVGFALAVYTAIRITIFLWGLPMRMRRWRHRRQTSNANRAFINGMYLLAEGRWRSAERRLLRHVNAAQEPTLNYLAAARAAQAQGAFDRRDEYLKMAHERQPAAHVAVGLTQAELQMDQGQYEQALATLRHLQQIAPKHNHVLRALARVYERLQDWSHLLETLPALRSRQVLGTHELDELERSTVAHCLEATAASPEELERLWGTVSRRARGDTRLLSIYVGRLLGAGKGELAEPLIRQALARRWDTDLVRYYGILEGPNTTGQLTHAEAWLKDHERDPALLLTLGRLCMREKLWGKARRYLEASIGIRPTPEAYHELGTLLDHTGEPDAAMECYRRGLLLVPGCDRPIKLGAKPPRRFDGGPHSDAPSRRRPVTGRP